MFFLVERRGRSGIDKAVLKTSAHDLSTEKELAHLAYEKLAPHQSKRVRDGLEAGELTNAGGKVSFGQRTIPQGHKFYAVFSLAPGEDTESLKSLESLLPLCDERVKLRSA